LSIANVCRIAAYRLNHEEVIKSLEEGIRLAERLNPVECIPDAFGRC